MVPLTRTSKNDYILSATCKYFINYPRWDARWRVIVSFFDLFKKKSNATKYGEITPVTNEGINAIFVFLDEVLPNYKDEDFQTVTPQIFLILYILGMTNTWCKISGLPDKYKEKFTIPFAVIEGIYDRYKIFLRDWSPFVNSFYDSVERKNFLEQKFIRKYVKQGEDHFFYFLTLKHIPHNPLDILLEEWTRVQFYNDNYPYEKGEIDGYFSKEEYSFISQIMMYELLYDIDKDSETVYKQVLNTLKKYPFNRSKYYLDT